MTMRPLARLLPALALLCGSLSAEGQTPPAAAATPTPAEILTRYEAIFDSETRKLDEKRDAALAALGDQYLASLRKLEEGERAAGKLDALVALREEIGRFERERLMTDFNLVTEPESIATRQQLFLNQEEAIRDGHARGVADLSDKLAAALDRLQIELTRQNQIEAALAARAQRDRTLARPEVAAARAQVEAQRQAEEAEQAELQKAMELARAAAPPPPVVDVAAPVQATKPERGDKARDHARIKARFEEFIEHLLADRMGEAEKIVDPEQARAVGSLILQAHFQAFRPYLRFAERLGGRVEAGDVRRDNDGVTAQNFPEIRVLGKRESGRPVDWVKRDGEWYIHFKDKPREVGPRKRRG
jgi:hypothetical protein